MADLNNISQELGNINNDLASMANILSKGIRDSLSDSLTDIENMVDAFEKGKDISKEMESKLISFQKQANKLSLDEISLQAALKKAQQDRNISLEKKLTKQLQENKLSQQAIEAQQTTLLNLRKIVEQEAKVSEEKKKQKGIQGELDDLKKKFRIEEIKDIFTLVGLLKIILDAALKFNEISVKTGKDLGYGADQADRVTSNLVDMAQHSTNLNFTLKNAAAAMAELNTATGGVAEYSANALETQIMLTKQFKLTGEEAAGVYKFAVLSGKASSQINDEMVGAFVSTRNMVKGSADFRKTIAEAAKVSGQLAINFKNNPAEITKAVVQAQILGTTLQQAKDQSRQLLEFESSIENELRAELLTGQQMNLERARAAALQGDQVTAMKELANQGMTLEKFQNMNVLAQESFAKALGLSADQLSDQLRKQKIAQEQGKSLAQLTKEEALEAQKRQDIQEKFNAAIDKLKDIIGNLVAGPMGTLLDALANVLQIVGWIVKPFMWIKDAIAWIVNKLDKIAGIGGIIRTIMKFTMPALAPTGGPAQNVGDLKLTPGKGPIVTTSENGIFKSFQGTKNDEVAMFPGAVSMARNRGGSSSMDLTPVVESNKQVVAAINSMSNRLANKDTSINMDSKTVGRTLTQTSTKLA